MRVAFNPYSDPNLLIPPICFSYGVLAQLVLNFRTDLPLLFQLVALGSVI